MNNRPITSRVKSGMFKTKEPLLNVGPAGVDGNNKTRTMPSPSKMKGYAMKSSPFKQANQPTYRTDKDGKLQVVLETQETTPGNAGTNGSTTYKSRSIENAKGGDQATDLKKYMEGLYKKFGDDVTTDELIKRKFIGEGGRDAYDGITGNKNKGVATVTPSTDGTEAETKEYEQVADPMRKVTGEASTAYESRNNLRKGIQANRKVKKGDIKNARSKAKGGAYYKADGTFVGASENKGVKETRKEARIANRAQKKEDKKDLKGMESGKEKRTLRKQMNKDRKNTKKKAIQNAKDKVRGFKDEKSDAKARQSRANQEIAKQEAAGALEQATQRKTGFSGNQSIRTTDVRKTNADIGDAKAAEGAEKKLVGTPATMKNTGFFKKKSPMKMNYFKK
jgi:hypothetical protein